MIHVDPRYLQASRGERGSVLAIDEAVAVAVGVARVGAGQPPREVGEAVLVRVLVAVRGPVVDTKC
jgi:hypothetical protein